MLSCHQQLGAGVLEPKWGHMHFLNVNTGWHSNVKRAYREVPGDGNRCGWIGSTTVFTVVEPPVSWNKCTKRDFLSGHWIIYGENTRPNVFSHSPS